MDHMVTECHVHAEGMCMLGISWYCNMLTARRPWCSLEGDMKVSHIGCGRNAWVEDVEAFEASLFNTLDHLDRAGVHLKFILLQLGWFFQAKSDFHP